jgi:hypothetical protein
MKPVIKLVIKKRFEFQNLITKQIKSILQMNLLTLLIYRWTNKIKLIQFMYRKYRIVKKVRVQVLYNLCLNNNIFKLDAWARSSDSLKYEILNDFVINECYSYSKSKCKYLHSIKALNKSFTRDFSLWERETISNAMGRTFTISLPPAPKFTLFNKVSGLKDFINIYETKLKKNKIVKRYWCL